MSSVNNPNFKPPWWKDILNGFIAWIIAFVILIIPAFVVGINMAFDLGPKLNDNAEVSRRISHAISEMYGSNLNIRIGYIVVLGILVFWRSWVNAGRSAEKTILHGATIGCAAAIMVLVQMASSGAGLYMAIPAAVSIAAGVIGGMKRVPHSAAL